MKFQVVIHKDAGSDYGVTVPELPGCFSAGSTLDEALSNAAEAVECHWEGLLKDSFPLLPAPAAWQGRDDDRFPDGILAFVDVDTAKLSGPPHPNPKVIPS
ncbi:MAG: hypothetical protein JWM59_816 [Verrucomicrobiales bacterium]|nr:hypothetical protein [Verrucomicrobiales bacterium]